MKRKGNTSFDELFAETKARMVKKIANMMRRESARSTPKREDTSAGNFRREGGDEMFDLDDFFGTLK